MEHVVGSSMPAFWGVTVVLFGGAAWMTGRALALAWRSLWLLVPYGLLLGLGARFVTYALFEGELLSPSGYVVSTAVIGVVMLTAYRFYRAQQMVRQYPWLYQRRGPFSWRQKTPTAG